MADELPTFVFLLKKILAKIIANPETVEDGTDATTDHHKVGHKVGHRGVFVVWGKVVELLGFFKLNNLRGKCSSIFFAIRRKSCSL